MSTEMVSRTFRDRDVHCMFDDQDNSNAAYYLCRVIVIRCTQMTLLVSSF